MKSMKKLVLVGLVLLASVMVLLPLVGCDTNAGDSSSNNDTTTQQPTGDGSGKSEIPKYTVKFSKGSNTDEVSDLPAELRVESGTVLTAEQLKSLADTVNCCFTGWYDGETEVEAGTYKVTKDVTLTAGWVEKFITFKAEGKQGLKFRLHEGGAGNFTTLEKMLTAFEYSVNGGDWLVPEYDTFISFGGEAGSLRLRGKNLGGTAPLAPDGAIIYQASKLTFETESPVACTGDIRTLVDYEHPSTVDTTNACFAYLFQNCSVLTKAPALPATTLADSCYMEMFVGCTSLAEAPTLPATTLADSCYMDMFAGCTSLAEAPTLPATTLANSCYRSMFTYCTSLSEVTMLATDISAERCLDEWLYGVAPAGTIFTAADTTLPEESIPAGWMVKDYVPQP